MVTLHEISGLGPVVQSLLVNKMLKLSPDTMLKALIFCKSNCLKFEEHKLILIFCNIHICVFAVIFFNTFNKSFA